MPTSQEKHKRKKKNRKRKKKFLIETCSRYRRGVGTRRRRPVCLDLRDSSRRRPKMPVVYTTQHTKQARREGIYDGRLLS